MPVRPDTTPPQPLALAQQRTTLDELLRTRVRALLAQTNPATGMPTEHEREWQSDAAAYLDAVVREFVAQVERHNDSEQRTAGTGRPLDYADAVLVEGTTGPLVVDADTWAAEPIHVGVLVGRVERVIAGADVLAVLRDDPDAGDAARRLGLT